MENSAFSSHNDFFVNDIGQQLQNGLPSKHHTPIMQKLCQPLKEKFKINYITYARHYDDGIAITSSDDDYTLYKLLHAKSNLFHGNTGTSYKAEWVDFDHPDLTQALQEKFSYLNGLSMIMKHQSFTEHIGFGTSYANTDIIKDLQKNQELLNNIIFYLRDAASDIINDADNYKIQLPKTQLPTKDSLASSNTNTNINTKKFIIIGENGDTTLTYMEKTCLIETLKLKTSKQIAATLGLSPKTIEHHLAKLKIKLGIKAKNQLYIIAQNNALI